MTGSLVSWGAWARAQRGLSASAALVLREVAGLVDPLGAAVVEVSWLADAVDRVPRTVFRALGELEAAGLLVRERRRCGVRQAPSRLQLVRGVRAARAVAVVAVGAQVGADLVSASVRAVGSEDNEGLRRALRRAMAEGWRGEASAVVALTALEHGARQFWLPIARSRRFDGARGAEAVGGVLTTAWLVARDDAEGIARARRPWAAWTRAVQRACAQESLACREDRAAVTGDGVVPEGRPAVAGAEGVVAVGVDDFDGGPLGGIVTALVGAGMGATVAWAGSVRIAQLSLADTSRRWTVAGRDPVLADLGASPKCAREWMTLLVGSARGSVANLVEAAPEAVEAQARRVVDEYTTASMVV